mmetsp:Transcript_16590/g.31347  ORF Transcript_16590/g.31347 Transcript_16590/m.31347 type:complete len:218 (-) Transcript_16590:673-1326(-)
MAHFLPDGRREWEESSSPSCSWTPLRPLRLGSLQALFSRSPFQHLCCCLSPPCFCLCLCFRGGFRHQMHPFCMHRLPLATNHYLSTHGLSNRVLSNHGLSENPASRARSSPSNLATWHHRGWNVGPRHLEREPVMPPSFLPSWPALEELASLPAPLAAAPSPPSAAPSAAPFQRSVPAETALAFGQLSAAVLEAPGTSSALPYKPSAHPSPSAANMA